MKIVITLLVVCSVFILGYASYVDSQNKKRQELIKIVNDAEHSLKAIQHNPNYVKHANLSTYQQKISCCYALDFSHLCSSQFW